MPAFVFFRRVLSFSLTILAVGALHAQTVPTGLKRLEILGSVKVEGIPENYDSVTVTCRVGEPAIAQQQQKLPLTLTAACRSYGPAGFMMVLQANNTPLPRSEKWSCDLTFHAAGSYVIAQNAGNVFNARAQSATVSGTYTTLARGAGTDSASVNAPPLSFSAPHQCKR